MLISLQKTYTHHIMNHVTTNVEHLDHAVCLIEQCGIHLPIADIRYLQLNEST